MDIAPLIKGGDVTEKTDRPEKSNSSRKIFSGEWDPNALYQINRAKYKTEPDSLKTKDWIYLSTTYRNATHHNRGDFCF